MHEDMNICLVLLQVLLQVLLLDIHTRTHTHTRAPEEHSSTAGISWWGHAGEERVTGRGQPPPPPRAPPPKKMLKGRCWDLLKEAKRKQTLKGYDVF